MIKTSKHVKKVSQYQAPSQRQGRKVRLDLNENMLGCSPKVLDALKNIDWQNISCYPEYDLLTEKTATHYKIESGQIIFTNGGDDAIRCAIDTYITEGDMVLLPVPTFSMFEIQLKIRGAKIKYLPYKHDFSFPFDTYHRSLCKGVTMGIIVNPGSPTGKSIKQDQLIRILAKANKNNIVILLDETYHHFSGKTNMELIKTYSNLIVMQTFSKAFGLAGMRLGFLASKEQNIVQMQKVNLPYTVNSLAVIAGLAAIEDYDHINKVISQVNNEREFLYRELMKLGLRPHMTETNFILVDCGNFCNDIFQQLAERGILVRNISSNVRMKNILRISIGTRKEHEILIAALKEIIPSLK